MCSYDLAASPDNDDIVGVVFNRISAAIDRWTCAIALRRARRHVYTPNDILRMPNAEASATATQKNVLAMSNVSLTDSSCT